MGREALEDPFGVPELDREALKVSFGVIVLLGVPELDSEALEDAEPEPEGDALDVPDPEPNGLLTFGGRGEFDNWG